MTELGILGRERCNVGGEEVCRGRGGRASWIPGGYLFIFSFSFTVLFSRWMGGEARGGGEEGLFAGGRAGVAG